MDGKKLKSITNKVHEMQHGLHYAMDRYVKVTISATTETYFYGTFNKKSHKNYTETSYFPGNIGKSNIE